ncbi:hypothetical protein HMPREF0992_01311 [Lachnospiraceae bacterium 6_1_63FAA]|nr:hypothetical protein HMPREF0992_01311 [Lachnospiraceae bacterium 6_1_63FAA]
MRMKKSEYKGIMIITSIMILLPMIIGVVLWDKLPSEIATHFGTDNQANGWSSKPMTVFGMPLLMLALQWFCFLITSNDPKKRNINKKMFTFVLWLVPIISLITMMSTYAMALGYSVDIGMIVNFLMGIVFIGIGNYMHKIKQNYTVGIKIPWTLSSEANWNKTHRMSSWLFIIGGILFCINGFFKMTEVLFVVIILIAVVPMVYSFVLYKKGI